MLSFKFAFTCFLAKILCETVHTVGCLKPKISQASIEGWWVWFCLSERCCERANRFLLPVNTVSLSADPAHTTVPLHCRDWLCNSSENTSSGIHLARADRQCSESSAPWYFCTVCNWEWSQYISQFFWGGKSTIIMSNTFIYWRLLQRFTSYNLPIFTIHEHKLRKLMRISCKY